MSVKWTRLVRYRSDDGLVKYGEPLLDDFKDADIATLARDGQLSVRICEGATALDVVPTANVETVQQLLGPLHPAEVPIIRCIGLNYKTHSQFSARGLQNLNH